MGRKVGGVVGDYSTQKRKVLFFVPNVVCYCRIILALWASSIHSTQHYTFVALVFVACGTDILDGFLARKLNQCSEIGIFLDVVADNILRTVLWTAVSHANERLSAICAFVICIEWTCFCCTQISAQAEKSDKHWKDIARNSTTPWIIQKYFENGFRNVLGGGGILALFFCPLFFYVQSNIGFGEHGKLANVVGIALVCFRLLDMYVETHFILLYVDTVLERDLKPQ